MNLILHILLFIVSVFLQVACDQYIKKAAVSNNVTTTRTITNTLAAPQQPQDKELMDNTTSNRIPGTISKEKCGEYKRTIDILMYSEKLNSTATDHIPNANLHFKYYNKTDEHDEYKYNGYKNTNNDDRIQPGITGGEITEYQEFPHMVLLGYQDNIKDEIQWNCGGSLITETFVLTAAHCVKGRTLPPKYVRVGITEKSDRLQLQERKVIDSIAYPEYNSSDKYHDIALVRLENDIDLTEKVYPACLHTEKYISQKRAIATGWGFTDFLGPSGSNDLMKVTLVFFTNENCTKEYQSEINSSTGPLRRGIDDDLMVCAGYPKEKKGTCQGDSGGPLQVRHLEEAPEGYIRLTSYKLYDIVGVTAVGRPCSLMAGVPGIYTRVSNYVKWIEDIVWPE